MASTLSANDQQQLEVVTKAAEALVLEMSKLISAENGLLGVAAQESCETVRQLLNRCQLWAAVTDDGVEV